MAKTEFEQLMDDAVEETSLYIPVKAGMVERMTVHSVDTKSLHPNLEDEFTFPEIGPSYRIISEYIEKINDAQRLGKPIFDEPIIVEKTRPDGYLILNGHHRWAAALKLGIKKVPVKIVNLPSESDIKKMLEKCLHDKRVTLDLDEVIFRNENDPDIEEPPKDHGKKGIEKWIRLGVPALFRFFTKRGYDIWVYSSNYYSLEDIQAFFMSYVVHVDGIITGMKNTVSEKKKNKVESLVGSRYLETIHIDNDMLLVTHGAGKDFEEFTVDPSRWVKSIMEAMDR